MALKPSEELTVAALTVGTIYATWQANVPNSADVRSTQPNNPHVYASVKVATWTSAAVVCGLALLARSPLVFITGAVVVTAEAWKSHALNAIDPATGKPATSDDSE
jgi:hypothetical protein